MKKIFRYQSSVVLFVCSFAAVPTQRIAVGIPDVEPGDVDSMLAAIYVFICVPVYLGF